MRTAGGGRGPRARSPTRSTIGCRRTSSSSGNTPTETCTMCWHTCRRFGRACVAADLQGRLAGLKACSYVLLASVAASAQSVDPAALLKPPADSWLTYHGDYSGRHHSPLRAITTDNVGQLALS